MGMTKHEAIEVLEEVKILDDSMFAYSQAYNDALDMAIEALKAQEARLLTAEDFESNPMLDDDGRLPCWCEDIICSDGWTAVSVGGVLPDHVKANGCRYWTSRPTDAQREATPWE